jgi:hypothetical protein
VFKDTIEQRIREIGIGEIRNALQLPESYCEDDVRNFVVDFVDNTIGGYSLYIVHGRYRVGKVAS